MINMDIPNIYLGNGPSKVQHVYCKLLLQENSTIFVRNNVTSLLYIRCGDCITFLHVVVPAIPASVTRIVATDESDDLVQTAAEAHANLQPRISFQKMDLLDKQLNVTESFDCILSFWGIRWTHNINLAFTNIKRLMNQDGIGFFVFESQNRFYSKVINELAENDKWKDYLTGILHGIPPIFYLNNTRALIPQLYQKFNLRQQMCFIGNNITEYKSLKALREFLELNYTAVSMIPEHDRKQFHIDVNKIFKQMRFIIKKPPRGLLKIIMRFEYCTTIFRNVSSEAPE